MKGFWKRPKGRFVKWSQVRLLVFGTHFLGVLWNIFSRTLEVVL